MHFTWFWLCSNNSPFAIQNSCSIEKKRWPNIDHAFSIKSKQIARVIHTSIQLVSSCLDYHSMPNLIIIFLRCVGIYSLEFVVVVVFRGFIWINVCFGSSFLLLFGFFKNIFFDAMILKRETKPRNACLIACAFASNYGCMTNFTPRWMLITILEIDAEWQWMRR